MRRLLIVTLLAALLPAGVAHGESTVIPTRSLAPPTPFGAVSTAWSIVPKLMGDRVGWADAGPGSVRVWQGDPATGRLRTIGSLQDGFSGYLEEPARFAASATRIAVSAPMHQGGFLAAGAPGGLRRVAEAWWDLDGDHLLVGAYDPPGSAERFDPASGERTTIRLPEPPSSPLVRSFRLAGDLIAYRYNEEGGVLDWRTGRRIGGMRGEEYGVVAGLEQEGTALWAEGSRGEGPFSVTRGAAEARRVPLPAGVVPVLGDGRLAYHDPARRAIVVTDLEGRELATSPVPPGAAPSDLVPYSAAAPDALRPTLADFDGRRAVWAYAPCAISLVSVWDVDAAAPRQPRPRCPAARLAGAVSAVDYAIRIPLRCPKARLTGCPTKLTVRRGSTTSSISAHLLPGARRSITVDTDRGRPRHLTVTTEPALRPARGERRTWRVRVGG